VSCPVRYVLATGANLGGGRRRHRWTRRERLSQCCSDRISAVECQLGERGRRASRGGRQNPPHPSDQALGYGKFLGSFRKRSRTPLRR
jgi:hypothetical protein